MRGPQRDQVDREDDAQDKSTRVHDPVSRTSALGNLVSTVSISSGSVPSPSILTSVVGTQTSTSASASASSRGGYRDLDRDGNETEAASSSVMKDVPTTKRASAGNNETVGRATCESGD